jgi:BatD DUF11 like domain
MTKYTSIYILFLLLISINSFAQNVQFVANANNNAKSGEPFIIQYKLEAPTKGKNFKYPEVKNLTVLNVGTSSFTRTSIINGKHSKSITLTWSLTAIAGTTGRLTIPAATVTVDGKSYNSNALTINVNQGSNNTSYTPSNQSNVVESSSQNRNELPNKDIFLNLTTNKTDVYLGEPIYIYNRLYSKYNVNLSEFNPSAMDNFWIQDLPMPNSVKAEYVTLNGSQYLTAVLEKKVIFPQKTGEIVIEPYNATFQLYDGWGFPAGSKKVVSNKKIITVKPLPANKPAGFTGAVGDFQISSKSDVDSLNIDEAVIITLTVSGLGNFGLFDDPTIKVPNTFEPLMPDTKNNTRITENGIDGSRTFTFTYIPRVPGTYNIKEVAFSYFNPKTKKYYTKKTNPITIIVIGDSTTMLTDNSIVKSELNEIAEDIRYIKTSGFSLQQKNNFFFGKLGFWLSYLIPFVGFLFLIFFMRNKIKENANVELVKSKKADKISKKRLKTAENHIKSGKIDEFYEEITNALWGYVSDKLSIPVGNLTRATAVETFKNSNISEDLITDFVKTIDDCETARFAPSSAGLSPEIIYEKASNIIRSLELKIN